MANSASDAGNSEKDIRIKLIESGMISQMLTLPSNMFTSVTLPATLWFFDKAKIKKDEILFIDARNIFTQIDRAHRKFSDEQIRNLGIITRLYEGKTEEFEALLADYRAKLADAPELSDDEDIMPKSYWQSNIDWLTERFPEGKYRDVVGLCKATTIGKIYDDKGNVVGYEDDSIGDQDFSLNPGRYVGVAIEDDGLTQEEFKERMMAYYTTLSSLTKKHTVWKLKLQPIYRSYANEPNKEKTYLVQNNLADILMFIEISVIVGGLTWGSGILWEFESGLDVLERIGLFYGFYQILTYIILSNLNDIKADNFLR